MPRIACLLADPALAADATVQALLADAGAVVVEAAGPAGLEATLVDAFGWAADLSAALGDPEVAGAVAVLGRDVLAEVAYLLDLAVPGPAPLVCTGAMRDGAHRSPDGPGNVGASLHLARHPALAGACATVVIAGRVHAARDVTRVCASSVEAFDSPALGPLGLVGAAGPVTLTRRPPRREHLPAARIEPAVAHVAAFLGSGGDAVDRAVAGGARGLVVETYAAGGVPPELGAGLARAVDGGVAVVAASRARGVPTDDPRPGGHAWLRERGVLSAPGLAPEKARVRLALALGLAAADGLQTAFPAPTPSSSRAPSSPRASSSAPRPAVPAPRPPSTR